MPPKPDPNKLSKNLPKPHIPKDGPKVKVHLPKGAPKPDQLVLPPGGPPLDVPPGPPLDVPPGPPLDVPPGPPPPTEPNQPNDDDDNNDIPAPPPPPPFQESIELVANTNANVTRPSSPDSASESEDSASEPENDDDDDNNKYSSNQQRSSSRISSDMIAPPPPPDIPPPPPKPDTFNFVTLDLEEERWKILKAGDHQLLKYCSRLRGVFLWLPPTMRWAKDVIVVQAARSKVLSVLDAVSMKIATVLIEIRKAWESLANNMDASMSINVHDDVWRWKFKEGWQKNNTNLKMAQNAQHINTILRSACMLLREYRNVIQQIADKVENTKRRDPQAGLRLSKARIKELILQKKLEAVAKEELQRKKEARIQARAADVVKSKIKAKRRVKIQKLDQVHYQIIALKKELTDQRIHDHLNKEFEPAWKTSVDVSESFIHALRHAIKLEQHHLERKRRRKAKFTYKATRDRVRKRVKEKYKKKPHVFVRPLSRMVDIRGQQSMRFSPVQPREILRR